MNDLKKIKKYSFLSDIEPSDEQLEWLMNSMIADVKKRAQIAEKKWLKLQKETFDSSAIIRKSIKEKYAIR